MRELEDVKWVQIPRHPPNRCPRLNSTSILSGSTIYPRLKASHTDSIVARTLKAPRNCLFLEVLPGPPIRKSLHWSCEPQLGLEYSIYGSSESHYAKWEEFHPILFAGSQRRGESSRAARLFPGRIRERQSSTWRHPKAADPRREDVDKLGGTPKAYAHRCGDCRE